MARRSAITGEPEKDPADVTDLANLEIEDSDGMDMAVLGGDLTGALVFAEDDELVGVIDEMVLGRDGETCAVIDVGEYLGTDPRPVAVDLDDLRVIADGEGALRVTILVPRDDLAERPVHET